MTCERKIISFLTVLAIATILLPVKTGANRQPPRSIHLEAVEGSPFLRLGYPPKAVFSVHHFQYGASGSPPGPSIHLNITGLSQQLVGSESSYALYFTTRPSPAEYIHGEFGSGRLLFNTDFGGRLDIWSNFPPQGFTIDGPTLTVFVAQEPDDGRPFNPASDMDRLAFVGTSTR
jgi:hypothetical protein